MGYLTVNVQDGGGIEYLRSTPDGPSDTEVYNPQLGKFYKLDGDYGNVLRQLEPGLYILRMNYPDQNSQIIKVLKQ